MVPLEPVFPFEFFVHIVSPILLTLSLAFFLGLTAFSPISALIALLATAIPSIPALVILHSLINRYRGTDVAGLHGTGSWVFGAVAFLGKPFTDEMLLETIHSALRGQLGVKKNLISLVDDDESIRRTTTLLIESFGFRATAFESAQSFLKSGQLHETSCLIVDVQMPGMNGLQLQSHLAAAGYKIPIIFITAHDNKESRQQALQAGAVAFLGKPFSDELLLQIIRAATLSDQGVPPDVHIK